MGDHHNAKTRCLQRPSEFEYLFDLAGIETSRDLVQDKNFGFGTKRLKKFDDLPLVRGQLFDEGASVNSRPHQSLKMSKKSSRLFSHRIEIQVMIGPAYLVSHPDIGLDGQFAEETQFLIGRPDSDVLSLARRQKGRLRALYLDPSIIRPDYPCDNFGQGGFTSSIGAN